MVCKTLRQFCSGPPPLAPTHPKMLIFPLKIALEGAKSQNFRLRRPQQAVFTRVSPPQAENFAKSGLSKRFS